MAKRYFSDLTDTLAETVKKAKWAPIQTVLNSEGIRTQILPWEVPTYTDLTSAKGKLHHVVGGSRDIFVHHVCLGQNVAETCEQGDFMLLYANGERGEIGDDTDPVQYAISLRALQRLIDDTVICRFQNGANGSFARLLQTLSTPKRFLNCFRPLGFLLSRQADKYPLLTIQIGGKGYINNSSEDNLSNGKRGCIIRFAVGMRTSMTTSGDNVYYPFPMMVSSADDRHSTQADLCRFVDDESDGVVKPAVFYNLGSLFFDYPNSAMGKRACVHINMQKKLGILYL